MRGRQGRSAEKLLAWWAVLLSATVASGALVCTALVVRRRFAPAAFLASAVLGAAALVSLIALHRLTGRADATIASAFIAVGGFLGGFALGASLVPILTRMPSPAAVSPAPPSGVPWVIFVAAGQPEHYDPSTVTEYFAKLARADVRLPGESARVLAYFSERARYRAAGLDPSRPVVRAVTARVTDLLRESGLEVRTAEAWLQGRPRLTDAISEAVGHGARDIACVLLGVAESYEFDQALKDTKGLDLGPVGVRVECAPPLWTDERLTGLVRDRILAALPGGLRPSDGVLFVASGQPWQWDRTHPQGSEHETFFCQKVRAEFLAAGLPQSHVRTAWLDWQEPDVTEAVRHLSAVGCVRIVVCPVSAPADTLALTTELPAAVAQAAVEDPANVQILHGWGEDEVVAQVLADAARTALAELGDLPTEGQ